VNSWIDLHALWQIVVIGMLAGAGLPALFAVGLRALSLPGSHPQAAADSDEIVGGNPAGIAAAGLCFAVVLAAVGWGIYIIVAGT
jgi:Mn2+/Fe2+ NRAMP family transporter